MSFRAFGSSTTLADVISERSNDAAIIDNILKRLGRDVTGKRALPTAWDDVISGDKEGDFLDSATERYELRKHSGVFKWIRWTINTSF